MQALQILSFLLVLTLVSADLFKFIDKELLRQSVNCSTEGLIGDGGLATPSAQPLEACEWYKDNTCCTPSRALQLQAFADGFVDRDKYKECNDYFREFYCAICSPKSADYFYTFEGGDFMMCKSFCNKIVKACTGVPSPFLVGGGPIISQEEAATYCDTSIESGKCFNSANSVSFIGLLILFAIFM